MRKLYHEECPEKLFILAMLAKPSKKINVHTYKHGK